MTHSHPTWGHGDQAGGSNWITPEKIFEALEIMETGTVYELGHVYERGMPGGARGTRTYASFVPATQVATLGEDLVYNEELLADEVHEFLFVFTPLRLKGASRSPGRTIAVR